MAEKRGSVEAAGRYRQTMEAVARDDAMLERWAAFVKDYSYAGELTLSDTCETVCEIIDSIGW